MAGKPKNDNDEPEVTEATVPPPGTEPWPIPAGLPPENYLTAQEAHVAGGGEYAPPEENPEEEAARKAKRAEEDRVKAETNEKAEKAEKGKKR